MTSKIKNISSLAIALALLAVLSAGASAQTNSDSGQGQAPNGSQGAPGQDMGDNGMQRTEKNGQPRAMNRSGIFGTITAANGTSITVLSKAPQMRRMASSTMVAPVNMPAFTPKTYTVDASNATIMKNSTTSTIASLAVGDTVMVQGTVNGTSITAKVIRDGIMFGGNGRYGPKTENQGNGSGLNDIQGTGQPVIAGNISSINGSSIVVTNGNASYTVDVTNAKIQKSGTAAALSNLVIGDRTIIQGTVNGSLVTAQTVIDQPAVAPTASGSTDSQSAPKQNLGFFGGIGQFFKKLFNF